MVTMLIGYARCSTDTQDLTAQRDGLAALGVKPNRVYVDHAVLPDATVTAPGCVKHWLPAEPATPSWSRSWTGWPDRYPTRGHR